MNELKITRETAYIKGREVCVLRLEGAVDAHTFTNLEEALTELVQSGLYRLLLDLEKLTHINSTGLGLLLATLRQVRQHGGDLVIVNMSERIRHVFTLLGLDPPQNTDEDEGYAGAPVKRTPPPQPPRPGSHAKRPPAP